MADGNGVSLMKTVDVTNNSITKSVYLFTQLIHKILKRTPLEKKKTIWEPIL